MNLKFFKLIWAVLALDGLGFIPTGFSEAQPLPATITVNAASTIPSFAPLSIFGTNLAYWVSQTANSAIRPTVQAADNYFLDRKSTRSELQSPDHLVCRLLLEKKKKKDSQRQNQNKLQHVPTRSHRTEPVTTFV